MATTGEGFEAAVIEAVGREREIELTTWGRKSGKPSKKILWAYTDGSKVYVRSGGGLGRDWTRNVLARDEGILHVAGLDVPVRLRHVSDVDQVRAISELARAKYGAQVQRSTGDEPLTPAESATFVLTPEVAPVLRKQKREDRSALPRVLILGGGFAGVYTAYRLQTELKRAGVQARIGIVNRENFFVFYPMLPEIISGSIGTEHILNPIRFVAKDSTLFTGEVTEIDLEHRSVSIRHGLYGHSQRPRTLYYDHLVIALGGVPGTQDVAGMNEHAFNVQRMSDAFALRNHLIDTLEQANAVGDRDDRRRLLTYVVIGGGPSGVEVIGELEHLVSEAVEYYHSIRPEDVRVVLVHAGDRLLPAVPEHLGHYTAELLARRGIEIVFNRRVTSIERHAVNLSDGSRIETSTVVGSLGLAVNPLLVDLPLPHDRKGAVIVHETLLAGDHPNVWAIGDNASVIDPHTAEPYPPTAQHAVREAGVVARNIAASLVGRALTPIDYHTKGRMVPLGGHSAVAEIYGITLTGFPAWWVWRTYYLYQLPRWEKRLRVMFDWTLDLAFPPPLVQLKVGQPVPMRDKDVNE